MDPTLPNQSAVLELDTPWDEVYDSVDEFLGYVVDGSVCGGVGHFRGARDFRPNEGENRGTAVRDANLRLTHSSVIPPGLSTDLCRTTGPSEYLNWLFG